MVRCTAVNYSVIREQGTGNREHGRGDRLQGIGNREHRKKDRINTY
ncbi:MAG: hypothetical protein ACK57R_17970 [Dolichospermum sp.]